MVLIVHMTVPDALTQESNQACEVSDRRGNKKLGATAEWVQLHAFLSICIMIFIPVIFISVTSRTPYIHGYVISYGVLDVIDRPCFETH